MVHPVSFYQCLITLFVKAYSKVEPLCGGYLLNLENWQEFNLGWDN